jgi:hypothetical protein
MAKQQQLVAQKPIAEAPPAADNPPQANDMYRVKGPGGLCANGIQWLAGDVVQLSEADALSVWDAIEPVK